MIQADDAEAPHEVPKDAAASVAAQNAAMLNALPFADTADFDDAARVSRLDRPRKGRVRAGQGDLEPGALQLPVRK